MKEATIRIDSLSHGGSGVGRSDELVVFVPYTAPGDLVKVQITGLKKNYAEGVLVELLEKGPSRIKPPCSVFGQCGGCQWQHVTYEEQLKQKQLMVSHALSRIAKEENIVVSPIIRSPQEFHYRNRAQFRSEGSKIGFYARKSHQLVEPDKCHILEMPLNTELLKIRQEIKNSHPEKQAKFEVFLTEAGGVARSYNKGHGEEFGFAQVNTKQNSQMQKYITGLIGKPERVQKDLLDLYCGNGNFSFGLHALGWRIYGVDLNRTAIKAARIHATQNTFFSAADVSTEVKR